MTFASLETSVESGRPIELYEFIIGSSVYRYTSVEQQTSFGGYTWFPRNITRSDPEQASDEQRQQLEISMPSDDEVTSRFIGIVPGQLMTLSVYRFHQGDPEVYLLWTGKITGAAYTENGAKCTLRGVTTEGAFSRPIPHFKYQSLCNHILYDGNCQVNKESFKFSAVVTATSGNQVTIPGISVLGADWAVGGYISSADTDFRLIVGQNGDILTMMLPFHSNPVGVTVDVYAGCDHTLATCNTKFNNRLNYGGYPYVPTKNPFDSGV